MNLMQIKLYHTFAARTFVSLTLHAARLWN